MKRTMKRLSLGRETLRLLSAARLSQINGGGPGTDGSLVYCPTYTQAAGTCLTCNCSISVCEDKCTIGGNYKTYPC